jgi:hypothetical protein
MTNQQMSLAAGSAELTQEADFDALFSNIDPSVDMKELKEALSWFLDEE